jgi:hypothetical protein
MKQRGGLWGGRFDWTSRRSAHRTRGDYDTGEQVKMAFHVGEKVVCVNDGPTDGGHIVSLKKGTVYTVQFLCAAENHAEKNVGIFVCGVAEEPRNGFCDCYNAERFRPLIERKTDISVFTEMLKTKELVGSGDDRVQDSNGGGCA